MTIKNNWEYYQQGPNCNYKKLNMDLNVKLLGLKHNFSKLSDPTLGS
jgi:hypothetical protein